MKNIARQIRIASAIIAYLSDFFWAILIYSAIDHTIKITIY